MLKKIKSGLAITNFLGGNFNSTTGNFSYGLQGLWIEDGQIIHAVEETHMTCNFYELWQNLINIGNDHFLHSQYMTPSLLFEDIQLSGTSFYNKIFN